MKSIIIYYSYSGNTKKVAAILAEYLKQKGEVGQIELIGLEEAKAFLVQCYRAFTHTKAEIQPVNLDLSEYDLICFGSPVWGLWPSAGNEFIFRSMPWYRTQRYNFIYSVRKPRYL